MRLVIRRIRALEGPNVFADSPALVVTLEAVDAGDVAAIETEVAARLEGFASLEPAGDDDRFPLASLAARTAQALARAVGAGGETCAVAPTDDGLVNAAISYGSEDACRYLLPVAVRTIEAAVGGPDVDIAAALEEARAIVRETGLGLSTLAIVEAAARRGIPWRRIGPGSLVQLGYGRHRRFILAAQSDRTRAIAVDIAGDKFLTKQLLEEHSIPVPGGRIVRSVEEAIAALEELRVPLAVKPYDGRQGKGVSLNITTHREVVEAFRVAREYSREVLVEETLQGRDFRVLVVDGRMIAAAERVPARVTGDGASTIAQLVEAENRNPLRGDGHEKALTKHDLDDVAIAFLERNGLTPESVPAAGATVFLRENANLSKGGTALDVTDAIHPEIRAMCERVARLIGLDICGIDLITEDITKPVSERGGVIEVNAAPGLRMHLHPSEGTPRDVGGAIVQMLYPDGENGRVPLIAITGTNGKTTVTRMVAHAVAGAGAVAGVTTTDGIWIGGREIVRGDTTGPSSARMVLSDPTVEVAVLETARGGITRRGLGWDWCDVGVMTNVREDHIGQDGIETLDDLLRIKRIVAERVREGGTLVLNADDARLAALPSDPKVAARPKRIVFFSLESDSPVVERHVAEGGSAYVLRDGWLVERSDGSSSRLVRADEIPATLGGAARYQIANVLAAMAACRAIGLDAAAFVRAMLTFSHTEHNPGRTNLYEVEDVYVLLDYGHNPDAFEAVSAMASRWADRLRIGIVGLPGDRDESVVRAASRAAAAAFDRIIVREDVDLRGREPGEIPELIRSVIEAERPEAHVSVIPGEPEALDAALGEAGKGGVVVWFYEKLEPALQLLAERGARPVGGLGAREPWTRERGLPSSP